MTGPTHRGESTHYWRSGNNWSPKACLHGCTVGNDVLVGIGAIVLDGAIVENLVMIGAGSLVPPGKALKSGHLYVGSPVKMVETTQRC